mmetsp:Transcript_105064/g.285287  ORF Transcript_105064/g.285287 Transcript_105064/m.285287 type:complete len:240 (-) Transcript_105064:240-959(-)
MLRAVLRQIAHQRGEHAAGEVCVGRAAVHDGNPKLRRAPSHFDSLCEVNDAQRLGSDEIELRRAHVDPLDRIEKWLGYVVGAIESADRQAPTPGRQAYREHLRVDVVPVSEHLLQYRGLRGLPCRGREPHNSVCLLRVEKVVLPVVTTHLYAHGRILAERVAQFHKVPELESLDGAALCVRYAVWAPVLNTLLLATVRAADPAGSHRIRSVEGWIKVIPAVDTLGAREAHHHAPSVDND